MEPAQTATASAVTSVESSRHSLEDLEPPVTQPGHTGTTEPTDGDAGSGSAPGAFYSGRTFSARGPFGPCPTVKVTRCPSRNSL